MFFLRELRPAISVVILFTLLIGFIVPGLFTGAMQIVLPFQANGSLLKIGGQVVGSAEIGQNAAGPRYFTPRPSALMGTDAKGHGIATPYNAAESGASNLGPDSAALLSTVQARIAAYRAAYGPGPVPADAATASGSGLDPDISLENARRQAPSVAAARHMAPQQVTALVDRLATRPMVGVIGTAHVNVLRLNLALNLAQDGAATP